MFLEIIGPIIAGTLGIRLHLAHSQGEVSATGERGKMARIESAYAYYQAGRVWHARPFPELQALLTAHPRIRNFDLPDALAGALRKVLSK
jgi:phage terminase large subunit-like protein